MEIYLSTLDRNEIFRVPYVDTEKVSFNFPLNSSEFENSSGKTITLIGEEGLFEMQVNSFFPHKLYNWLPFNFFLASDCLKFILTHRKSVLKLVVVSVERTITKNVYISDFDYFKKRNGDIEYNLSLKEYCSK